MKILFKNIAYTLFSILLFTACDDNTSEDLQNNLRVTGDLMSAQLYFWNTYTNLDKAARDSSLWEEGSALVDSAHCILIPDDAGFVMYYGDENVLCPDGLRRRGAVNIALFSSYFGDSLDATVTFTDFYIEDERITGQMNLKGKLHQNPDMRETKLIITDGTLSLEGDEIIWSSEIDVEWYQGMSTRHDLTDDACKWLGSSHAEGTASNLIGYKVSVMDSLMWSRSCQYIVAGRMFIEYPALEFSEGEIDFGKGKCDAMADLIFGGSTLHFYYQ